MSNVIRKQQCPKCKSLGKDNAEDNLAVYSDGHHFCYSCKYTLFPNGIEKFKNENKEIEENKHEVYLPEDVSIFYPREALDWIHKYSLTTVDLLNHNVVWSKSLERLIFPIHDEDWNLLAWIGRSFNKEPKWFGSGINKELFHILGKGKTLVLTEDIVSAIKVSKCNVLAMPLFGAFIGLDRFKRIYNLFGNEFEVKVWLDFDKRAEALKEAALGRLYGLRCSTIVTELDPKEVSYEEIKQRVG